MYDTRLMRACAPTLAFATELGSAFGSEPSAEVRQRARASLDEMVAMARRAGVAQADVAEARYALVALIDERVLCSGWSGRTEWMSRPLQLELYRESTAGENFFVRLRAHLRSGLSNPAIEIYYLCLLLGFSGAYAGPDGSLKLRDITRAARHHLARDLPASERIAPNAMRKGQLRHVPLGWAPILALLCAGLVSCLAVVVAFAWLTEKRLSEVVAAMAVEVPAPSSPAAARPSSALEVLP
jgi:type IV/VI secretion system ImpK/VasF family protein